MKDMGKINFASYCTIWDQCGSKMETQDGGMYTIQCTSAVKVAASIAALMGVSTLM